MKKLYLIPALLLMSCATMGQTPTHKKAVKHYEAYRFAEAAKAYEKVLKAEPGKADVMAKLIQCYVRLGEPEKASAWLDKAGNVTVTDAKDYRVLAAMLAANGRHKEAGLLYEKAVAANDSESIKWLKAYNNLSGFYEDSLLFEIRRAPFSAESSDFSPAFYENGIVFSSSRGGRQNSGNSASQSVGFIDLFYVRPGAVNAVAFSADLNSKYHEGPLSFSMSQDTVYFTRSNFQQKAVFSKDGVNHLKIFSAILENGKWRNIQALPFNSNEYSVGHPALADAHTLYFVSDMPGGFGGTDLYKTVKERGVWQKPVNLGPEINTAGNEMFPFVDEGGTLYFASDGHPGLGGLDIFQAPRQGENFGAVQSMGYPINTSGDDFGLIIRGDSGYYSSNRRSVSDDIYTFKINRVKQVVLMAEDKEGKPLQDVQVSIGAAATADQKLVLGKMPATLDWTYGQLSKLTLSKKGYTSAEVNLTKTDFFKYNALDTIRVVMPKTVVPKGDKKAYVAFVDEKGDPIYGGKVQLIDSRSGIKKAFEATDSGMVAVTLSPGVQYNLIGTKQGYKDALLKLDASVVGEMMPDEELLLNLKDIELFAALKVGETIEMEIEYDLDKADIRPGAAQLLDKLVTYMQKYPGVEIELGAHTDSRGTNAYNQALSQRRAEAAVAYVVSRGVEAGRVVAIGYGKSRLKIANAKTEAQHQSNRRTTLKIIANKSIKASASRN